MDRLVNALFLVVGVGIALLGAWMLAVELGYVGGGR